MIEIKNISKTLGENIVLKDLSLTIKDGEVFGLVGINGAGKSTLLRLLSGIYKTDSGEILFDGKNVFENIKVKKDFFFLSDNPYYPTNSTVSSLLDFYSSFYDINKAKFIDYIDKFKLDCTKQINNFSKGMKRQLFIALAISIAPKYLFLDEAFDGLDPLARLIFKRAITEIIDEKEITIIISSHSLRELEDICDSYGLLDEGKIQNTGSIVERKNIYHKYQLAFNEEKNKEFFKDLEVISFNKIGRIIKIVVSGDEDLCDEKIKQLNPILVDKIPIDFEELFLIEVEAKGYINYE